jgi:hypothetical protein
VYACGSTVPLPGRQARVAAVQALLRALSRLVDSGDCSEVFSKEVAVWQQADDRWGRMLHTPVCSHPPPSCPLITHPGIPCCNCRPPGSFCGLRLLAGEPLEAAAPALRLLLAEAVLKDPPYEMSWLRAFSDQQQVGPAAAAGP